MVLLLRWQCSRTNCAGLPRGSVRGSHRNYRPWLRRKLAQAKERLLDGLDDAGGQRLTGDQSQGSIQYYSIALLLYDRATARGMVLRLLPAGERVFFLQHCGLIEKV